MTTYLGWPVITCPAEPAPASCKPTIKYIAGASMNPFNGSMQTYDWNASYTVIEVTMPPMDQLTSAPWIAFLQACKGIVNVFVIGNTTFAAQIPAGLNPGGYWRMNKNDLDWSVNMGLVVGMTFEIRSAT